jgi:hypothetical protein
MITEENPRGQIVGARPQPANHRSQELIGKVL